MAKPAQLAIDAHTNLLAVIGQPIEHSLSPCMHNAALAELGLNWRYMALPVAPQKLAEAVNGLAAIGCRGLSVTIPHKECLKPLLSRVDSAAEQLGAINCLVPDGQGGWWGSNTDWSGFLAPIGDRLSPGGTALVLGVGGVVRAVLRGCLELGVAKVLVRGRNGDRLAAMAEAVAPWAPPLQLLAWDEPLEFHLAHTNLVINGTPLGMAPWQEQSPLSAAQLAQLPASALIYDVIYSPRPTRLLQLAAERGLACQDGLEMLVQQGAAALRLWTGLEQVPVATMRAAVEQALGDRAA
jgi:shikimate dehydrogenase